MARVFSPTTALTFPITYFKQVRQEVAKVTWPTRERTIRSTVLVISASVALGVFIGGLDLFFTQLIQLLIR